MTAESFSNLLIRQIKRKRSHICIGLDPEFSGSKRIPDFLLKEANGNYNDAIFEFNKSIIDNTSEISPIYKPQSAFYEKYDANDALKKTIEYAHSKECLIILDAKRNDIGNTSNAYATAIFDNLNANATTINGYLGSDCITPFLKHPGTGIFILVKTSNKSSGEFQDIFSFNDDFIKILNEYIAAQDYSIGYEDLFNILSDKQISIKLKNKEICARNYIVMARLIKKWSNVWEKQNSELKKDTHYSDIGAVVGATYPEQLKILRKEMPNVIFLIPGYGAQGGTASDVIYGFNDDGFGSIINSSRGIDYAYINEQQGQKFTEEEFGEASKVAATLMRDDINKALEKSDKIAW